MYSVLWCVCKFTGMDGRRGGRLYFLTSRDGVQLGTVGQSWMGLGIALPICGWIFGYVWEKLAWREGEARV